LATLESSAELLPAFARSDSLAFASLAADRSDSRDLLLQGNGDFIM